MQHALLLLTLGLASVSASAQPITYPPSERGDVVDESFGVKVLDPYRWLENDVRQDPRVKAWVDAQNQVTDTYLATLPQRATFEARLKELWDFEKFLPPVKEGGRYFYRRNSGLQNQYVVFVQEGLTGAPRQLIDPNTWSKDGATALAEWAPSEDGKRLAYTIQDGGSDWRTVRVVDVDSGKTLPDEIKWVKFSGLSWLKDNSGFFYSRFPEPKAGAEFQSANTDQTVYFHKLGTPQAEDRIVYATADRPTWGHGGSVSDDGRWLVVTSYEGTDDRYEVTVIDLTDPAWKPRTLVKGLENNWSFIGNQGDAFYFLTDKDAPRRRIVAMTLDGGPESAREIVPQGEATLDGASLIGGQLIASYLVDARSEIRRYALDGNALGTIALPGIGSAGGFGGDAKDSETFYVFTSYNAPTTIYRYDTASGRSEVFKAPKVPFDPAQYEVRQEFYASKDGTRVPMFIVHKKGLNLAGGAPTLLYGYGGFNVSETPAFSVSRLAWMEAGGVFVAANIRGGGEYGKAWHDAGRLLKKQNVFDDFIGAAEHLIKAGITTPQKLAVMGGSNGGLLVGAVVNQRPDLFAAAVPAVGVMDMLRYNQFTAGRYWVDDYGDPAKEEHFRNLLAYSPYHNIKSGADYPAILVTTADTDDRVVPGHSFKYAAALQAAKAGDKPHLIRIETRAGHGSGKPTDKIIEEYADIWAFVAQQTGLKTQ